MNNARDAFYKINFSAPITTDSVRKLIDILSKVPDEIKELHLYINSPGGSVTVALGLVEFLKTLPCKIVTYNTARCDSAAILLFVVGEERICDPQASLFAHTVSVELSGEYTIESIRLNYLKLRRDYRSIIAFLSQKTNLSFSQWKNYMTEKGHTFSAQEAFECGLATRIVKLPIEMFFYDSITSL